MRICVSLKGFFILLFGTLLDKKVCFKDVCVCLCVYLLYTNLPILLAK